MCNCKEALLAYNFKTDVFAGPTQIDLDPLCNAIIIKNAGNTNLIFQGDIMIPGESKAIGGNRMEILRGRIDLGFTLPVPAPPVPQNLAFITQKFYLPSDC
jgi:hypothetical protein